MRVALATILLVTFTIVNALSHTIPLNQTLQTIDVLEKTPHRLTIKYCVPSLQIDEINASGTIFTQLTIDGFIGNNDTSRPELPYLGSLISVPINADLQIKYTTQKTAQIALKELGFTHPIYPAQPSLPKSKDMSRVSFVYDTSSYANADYQVDYTPFSYTEVGFARGERVFQIAFTPVRYSPVENSLLIYTELVVEIDFVNADFAETEYQKARTWSADFEAVFQTSLLNYQPPTTRDYLTMYPTKYVIICHTPFADAMQPFVDWKIQSGFEVIFVTTATTGTSTTAIKAYLQNLWDTATPETPAPTYLLIVGDTAQIPANNYTASPWDDPHITDLTYVRLSGTDYLPEMYFGRFSANNLTELAPYIDKTLLYEKYQMPDPTYLRKSMLIAGADPQYSTRYCNSQVNYLLTQYFRADSQYHTFDTPYSYLNPSSSNQGNNIRANLSSGVGWANYSAHGDTQEWSDPLVTNAQVTALTNAGKYPVVIGNACLTNAFDTPTSFSEAWMRTANKGAVAYIGGTDYTYWDEDWFWAVGYVNPNANGSAVSYNASQLGMYDRLFHTHGEIADAWNISLGAMVYAGNTVVQSTNSDLRAYYWEIYGIMGDPSLVPYLGLPATNTAIYPTEIMIGQQQLTVTNATPLSRIAISRGGVLHGVAIANESGTATLDFDIFNSTAAATLVITSQNQRPVIASLTVTPNSAAFVAFESVTNPQTSSNTVSFGATSQLFITVKNVGSANTQDLTFSLSTTSTMAQILTGNITAPPLNADATYTLTSPFNIRVPETALDQTILPFTLTATSQSQTWQTNLTVIVNAPKLEMTVLQMVNSAGQDVSSYQPGDSGTLHITFVNTGHLTSSTGTFYIPLANNFVTLDTAQSSVPQLSANGSFVFTSPIHISSSTPMGTIVPVTYLFDAQTQKLFDTVNILIGLQVEGFETGNFSAFPWTVGSTRPWTVITANPATGTYCAQSAINMSGNQSSTLQITWPTTSAGVIQFSVKVSSESGYDFLKFYINNVQQWQWSGNLTTWQTVSFPVPANSGNIFRWVYSKDSGYNEGQDRAWIDNIIFPASVGGNISSPLAVVNKSQLDFGYVQANATVSTTLSLVNFGNSILTGNITLPAHITLSHPLNINLTPHSIIDYTVTFSGSEVGAYSGNFAITTNDTAHATFNLPVSAFVAPTTEIDLTLSPTSTMLYSNYPNPFNPSTTIVFDMAKAGYVALEVYNVKGQRVKTLATGEYAVGRHTVEWKGDDATGRSVSSGIYFYRMTTDGYTSVKKMLMVK